MMWSDLKISESVSNKIPEIILAHDYNPNMSSIESPISSARKRFNAYVINEHAKNKKANLSPDQVSALWEKRFLKSSKTLHQIGKYEQFSKDLLLEFPKEYRNADFPPQFVETRIRSERGPEKSSVQKNRKRRCLLTKGDSLSTLTQEDSPPDLCDELFDFFERQNNLKGNSKAYKLTGSKKKIDARNPTAISYYVAERLSRSDHRGSSGIPINSKSPRKETNTQFSSERKKLESSLELGYTPPKQNNVEKKKKKRKKTRKLRDQQHAAIEYNRIRNSKNRSTLKKSFHSSKKKTVSYLSSQNKDEAVVSMYSAKKKNLLHYLDGESSIMKKPFPEAA